MPKQSKRLRKAKTPAELQAEVEEKMRGTLIAVGVPAHRVAGDKIHDFQVAQFSDIVKNRADKRTLFRVNGSIVDKWLREGGTGFEEPQKRAIEHCRGLWALLSTERKLCMNYTGVGGGSGDSEGEVFARLQLAEYERDIPRAYWAVWENVVRFDMPAGRSGSHLATTTTQQQAHAKAAVGFVASLIAQWRGY